MIELALDELLNAEVATLDALLDAELWLKIQHTVVRIPDEYSRYANFKHRLWFIWYIWYIAQLQLESGKRLPWSAVVHGADANGDLWLWEDEDEKCIKEFAEDLTYVPEMPMEYWDDACRALEARQLRTTELASPLSHLTPKTRLRFIAWLIVAGPVRMNQILQEGDFRLGISITRWDRAISDSPHNANSDAETCKCRVLRIWFETMLEVYLLEDLQSTPWYHTCNCFHSQLGSSTHSRQRNIPEKPLCKDSVTLRVLYELIVPPWLLLHWVIFRMAGNVQANCVQTFLDILNGEHNLFDWDDNDNSDLYRVLVRKDGSLGLYPRHWTRYMVEIDLQTWQQLSNKTRTANKNRPGYEMRIRLTAMLLIYSSTPITFQKLLGPLASDPIFDNFPFATMARVADKHYKRRATADDFQLDDFGATPNLQNWLLAWSETLCHDIWCTSPTSFTALERVQAMHLNLTKQFPQNLCMYAHSLMHRWPGHSNGNIDIFFDRSFEVLRSIKSYYFDVEVLLSLLKQSVEKDISANHTISAAVYKHMNRDISVLVVRLVLLLCDSESYKTVLACRGKDAQGLLDLLQDLLDLDSFLIVKPLILKALLRLSRASGLHPRCFALPELQKVGHQVAAGGFGDLWKGLVRGQSVSVKVMRVLQNARVETLLKEFSREALIWRQLCHPNVLPFFGLYYLENRLCLISPWMENGNMMEFLAREYPASTDRLSLILDVALGLQYLHEQNVVHGDLKAINILVTPSRRACIADFGVSSIANAMTLRFTHSTIRSQGGTARYQAPELFPGEHQNHFGSDVYAFACIGYEIMTGEVPFYELQNDMAVMFKVLAGSRPLRPMSWEGTEALDNLWELINNCWDGKAELRPTAPQIVERLVGPSIRAETTSSTTDWDDKFTSKFRCLLHAQPLLPSVTQIERMLFGDVVEACTECFPKTKSIHAKGLKRRYEEEASDSDHEKNRNPPRIQSPKRYKNGVFTYPVKDYFRY